jgi:outer membrane cobalamin receptor
MDFIASVYIVPDLFSLEASVSNILDADYSYVEGYPAPGRQFYLGLRYKP